MATIIEQRSPDGTVRRCTANCHNAKKPTCRCVCDGKNHGAAQPMKEIGKRIEYHDQPEVSYEQLLLSLPKPHRTRKGGP